MPSRDVMTSPPGPPGQNADPVTANFDAVKAVVQDIDHHGEVQELIPDHIGSAADGRAGKRKYIDPELRGAMAGKGTVLPLG